MTKNGKIFLGVAVGALALYLAYRWYKSRSQAAGTGVPQLGTNLNSMAPELVGGSAGPSSGPQVTMPVTITLTESNPVPPDQDHSSTNMEPINVGPNNSTPLNQAATNNPPSTMPDIGTAAPMNGSNA